MSRRRRGRASTTRPCEGRCLVTPPRRNAIMNQPIVRTTHPRKALQRARHAGLHRAFGACRRPSFTCMLAGPCHSCMITHRHLWRNSCTNRAWTLHHHHSLMLNALCASVSVHQPHVQLNIRKRLRSQFYLFTLALSEALPARACSTICTALPAPSGLATCVTAQLSASVRPCYMCHGALHHVGTGLRAIDSSPHGMAWHERRWLHAYRTGCTPPHWPWHLPHVLCLHRV